MHTVRYDGSLAGLLSVVFDRFANGLQVDRLVREHRYAPAMFEEAVRVATDEGHARRVWQGLGKFEGFDRELVLRNWLFDTTESDTDIAHVITRMFREQADVSEDYRDEAVFRCYQVHKKMFREIHRVHAFVRFEEAEDGLYFSRIDPDFDVLPLAVEHFEDRYQDQEWMIWDGKRDYGFWYAPGGGKSLRVGLPPKHVLDAARDGGGDAEGVLPVLAQAQPDAGTADAAPAEAAAHEDGFQRLWSTYFDAVNIEARRNFKLHRAHVPLRYWRHLTEKTAALREGKEGPDRLR